MKLFKVEGIKPPGRVQLPKYGEVKLYEIDDKLAEKLWRLEVPYLTLTDAGRKKFYPEKSIKVKKVKVSSK